MKPAMRPLGLLCLAFILLAACDGMPIPSGLPFGASAPVDATPQATPTRVLQETNTLTVCMGAEPVDLFLYNQPSYEKLAVLAALYDGPIDRVDYQYQPVILEKIPSLADGDAVVEAVDVPEGTMILDANGQMTPLLPGAVVRPAGCRSQDCAVTYEGGTLAMDQMWVTFHLKPGLAWSDGMPLTASDSVFSYRVAVSEFTTYSLGGLVSLSAQTSMYTSDYTAPDDLTTVWTGLPGFLDPTYQANFFIPLPQHVLARFQVEELLTSDDANRMPLGWGPYQLTRWDAGQQIVLERNPNYFRAAEGLPYFDRLVYRFVGQDPVANLSGLQSGACDVLLAGALPPVPTADMLALADSGAAILAAVPGLDGAVWEQLTFSVAPPVEDARTALFAEPRLRHAVAFCLDRQTLADSLYRGYASTLNTYLPEGHPLLAGAEVSAYPYEPATGMALLDEIGWRDEDGDGTREAHAVPGIADGTPLQFTLTTTDASYRGELGTLVNAYLHACGMDATLVQAASRDLFAQDPQAVLTGRHFDLAQYSFPGRWTPPCEIALGPAIPSGDTYWEGSNLSGYVNPAYDMACMAALAALPGTAEYASSHQEALRLFSADLPVLPLFVHVNFAMTRPDLTGLSLAYTQGSEMIAVESFRLTEP